MMGIGFRKVVTEKDELISDEGIVEKRDWFGVLFSIACLCMSALLICLGILALAF